MPQADRSVAGPRSHGRVCGSGHQLIQTVFGLFLHGAPGYQGAVYLVGKASRLMKRTELSGVASADVITCLPSSLCAVGYAFVKAVLVYQISKTKTEI